MGRQFFLHVCDNQVDKPSSQMGTAGVARLTNTSPPPASGPANGHLSQSHSSRAGRCQRRDEICMKTRMFSKQGPVLINDSIQRRLATEYIYYTLSSCASQFYAFGFPTHSTPPTPHPSTPQNLLATLHCNEAIHKLCLKNLKRRRRPELAWSRWKSSESEMFLFFQKSAF